MNRKQLWQSIIDDLEFYEENLNLDYLDPRRKDNLILNPFICNQLSIRYFKSFSISLVDSELRLFRTLFEPLPSDCFEFSGFNGSAFWPMKDITERIIAATIMRDYYDEGVN